MLITHDFAFDYGGAERVTEAFARAFPEAELLFVGADRAVLERMGVSDRATTILPLGRFRGRYRSLAPIYPLLAGSRSADVVLSSSYAFAHHVRARDFHLEYCHSPLRQLWVAEDRYRASVGGTMRAGMTLFGGPLRRLDRRAVERVDELVASCENVRARIRSVYAREAAVLHPPVDTAVFRPSGAEREAGLALAVARLVEPYKAVRSLLDVFAQLPYRLVVAGDGRDGAALRASAPPNVEFVGHVGDDELRDWYGRASLVVFPGEDDFGLVPVEAMACGTPVVAADGGGARETVVHGATGLRFRDGGLEQAVRQAMETEWDASAIRLHALAFDTSAFVERIRGLVAARLGEASPPSLEERVPVCG